MGSVLVMRAAAFILVLILAAIVGFVAGVTSDVTGEGRTLERQHVLIEDHLATLDRKLDFVIATCIADVDAPPPRDGVLVQRGEEE